MNKTVILGIIFFAGLTVASFSLATKGDEHPVQEKNHLKTATFAGGCFWCMEEAFDQVEGVVATISGYAGGHMENPTYKEVSSGKTGHAEVVQIHYDPQITDYEELLEVFWRNIDPTTKNRQFCDIGNQYRPAIFYHNNEQKDLALKSKSELLENKPFAGPVFTEIAPLLEFYRAEEYHQDFYKKNPIRYTFYKKTCGREKRLKELWG